MFSYNEEMYKMLPDLGIYHHWTTSLSDGTVLDLSDSGVGGGEKLVEYHQRHEYLRRALHARLVQSDVQCKAIKDGLSQVIPGALLNIGTHEELEEWVSGKNYIDVEMLKRHTVLSGVDYATEDSKVMGFFWQMLEEITQSEKQEFIQFIWGQKRLPPTDEDFVRQKCRLLIKPDLATRPDKHDLAMPKADTCFFNLTLPNYSSLEVMKRKIFKAIELDCVTMNAEELNPDGNRLDTDNDY